MHTWSIRRMSPSRDATWLTRLGWLSVVVYGFDPGATLIGASIDATDLPVPLVVTVAATGAAFAKFEYRDL